ncbi:ImmA/IrrE family metallo-endopeptidase [Pontibacter sp. H259]|uniref:ImmA/IrrE family metallo-endopeptidase n=1 Tax=Pontibacter sp. H259 TaxID=3133421 RepID=UPI0030C5C012
MLTLTENFIEDKFTIDELLKRSWSFRNSDEFIKFFDFIARFNHYSRYNTMLVYIQNPAVTFFGGVSYWKKNFGRTIKEEARPYIILAPMGPVLLVYDVFDTEGKETPEQFLERNLGRKPNNVKGRINARVLANAITEAENWGIKIKYKPLSYFNGGYVTTIFSNRLEICLKEGASIEESLAVLIHELAHLYLGHTGHQELFYKEKDKPAKLLQRKISRSAEELEAETISYLICKKLGLQSSSAEYIAGYITCETDLIEFSYETVIKIADKIEKLFVK